MKRSVMLPRLFYMALLITATVSGALGIRQCHHDHAESKRAKTILEMVSLISNGDQSSFIVDADALTVSGEDQPALVENTMYATSDSSAVASEKTFSHANIDPQAGPSTPSVSNSYTLTAYGTISIPSIDCDLPLWVGAGTVELRYGAGWMPLSAEPGQSGNCVIFGHRMKRYGSLFNRLGEVQIGDRVYLDHNGERFTYIIDQVLTIDPSELSFHMQNEGDPSRITLVTCTPIGVGSHRLILTGHLS